MRYGRFLAIVMFLVSTIVYAADCSFCVCTGETTQNTCTECCKSTTKLDLHISKDGKMIVDQNGKEVARFVEGTQVKLPPKGNLKATEASLEEKESIKANTQKVQKMQGCMRCTKDCIIYDGERCVQWVRSCTWDFDC